MGCLMVVVLLIEDSVRSSRGVPLVWTVVVGVKTGATVRGGGGGGGGDGMDGARGFPRQLLAKSL